MATVGVKGSGLEANVFQLDDGFDGRRQWKAVGVGDDAVQLVSGETSPNDTRTQRLEGRRTPGELSQRPTSGLVTADHNAAAPGRRGVEQRPVGGRVGTAGAKQGDDHVPHTRPPQVESHAR